MTSYKKPYIVVLAMRTESLLDAGTHLDPNQDNQSVTPVTTPTDPGTEFGSKKGLWSNDDEDE